MLRFLDKVKPEKTAVLVIDMSNAFVGPGAFVEMGNKFAPKLGGFLDICRGKGLRVIYTTHTYRADGADKTAVSRLVSPPGVLVDGTSDVEIYAPCAPKADDIVIKKHFYSGFYGTELDIILRSLGIETVVITGVCTDVCCFATARDAFFRGYGVVILSDLTGTVSWPDIGYGTFGAETYHVAALNNLHATNADVTTSEEFSARIAESVQSAT
jgi:ureidoacrylate peracid hydrolase